MRVVYRDERTCRLCTQQKLGKAEFGEAGWKRLKNRIKELEASASIADLLLGPGGWHPLLRERRGCYSGTVTGALRIIVQEDDPDSQPGTAIVLEIVDYH